MLRLLLVRHGESEWNAAGRWQGQADPPLSDHGRIQAQHAAKTIGSVDAVVASDLERARHTAELIGDELGVGPVHLDARLIERDAGEWSGLTRAEINEQWPGYLLGNGHGKRPPGWESNESLIIRSSAAIFDVALQIPEGDVLVVTHGGVIYALEEHLGAERQYLPNLGARWVELSGGTLRLGPRAELIDEQMAARPDTQTDRSAI